MNKQTRPYKSGPRTKATGLAGVDNPHIAKRFARDIEHAFTFEDDDAETRLQKLSAGLEMVRLLEPRDALEAQLIVQIVCTHTIATEAMRRANMPGRSEDGYYKTLRISAKFMNLFQEQMRTLTKYRSSPGYRSSLAPKKVVIHFVSPKHDAAGRLIPPDQRQKDIIWGE